MRVVILINPSGYLSQVTAPEIAQLHFGAIPSGSNVAK
jgi:hypothetical protein